MTNEEAIAYLEKADTTVYEESKTRTAEAIEMAIEALKERKTGKWELTEMGDFNLFACSECGYRTINRWWKACPNCDAKMEVEHDEQ